MRKIAIAVTILLAAAACSKKEAVQQSAATPAQPAASVAPAAAPVPLTNALAGKVVETFNGGGYTYLRIATASGDQWAAVRETKIAKGATVTVDAQLTMEKFESKTLNRTFDRIVFGAIAGDAPAAMADAPGKQAAMPPTMPPQMASSATASQHMQSPAAAGIQIERAEGGKTVAELWAEKGSLKNKDVVVRGKVVKFLGGIMGKNWMHIQDGTGSAEKGNNDITVTTNEKVTVGEVVTVKGTLAADKDFGAGYLYEVIIENAKVQ